jgi:hypothetical protein
MIGARKHFKVVKDSANNDEKDTKSTIKSQEIYRTKFLLGVTANHRA